MTEGNSPRGTPSLFVNNFEISSRVRFSRGEQTFAGAGLREWFKLLMNERAVVGTAIG